MNWIIFFIFSLLMIFTPIERGLFFETDIYKWEVLMGVVFLVAAFAQLKKSDNNQNNGYLFFFSLPLIYLLAQIWAESPKSNLDVLYRWGMYTSLFCTLVWVRSNEKIERLMPVIFQVSGIVMSFIATLGYCGWFQFKDLIWDGRLTGTFQYPNTFGTLMGAFWLYSLIALTKSRIQLWVAVIYSLPIVAYVSGLLLSESRGTLVMLPLAWFLGLILLGLKRQLLYILNTVISLGISFPVYRKLVSLKQAGASHPGFLWFLVGTLVMVGVLTSISVYFRSKRLENLEVKSKIRFVFPVLAIIVGGLLSADIMHQGMIYHQLPASFQDRISNIGSSANSVLGRTAFYEDGLKISNDAPWFGLGGGGWQLLFTKYQHQPYWSTQTHNGYLEVLLNTGWIGLIIFVLVFIVLFLQIIRRIIEQKGNAEQTLTIATVPALIIIFLHAFIDFDFSYGVVWFIILWLIAMGVSDQPLIKREFPSWIGKSNLILVSIFVMVFSFLSFKFLLADQAVAEVQDNMDAPVLQKIYDKASYYNPYDTSSLIALNNLYIQAYNQTKQDPFKMKSFETIQQVLSLEPNNPKLTEEAAKTYFSLGDYIKGTQYIDKALQQDKYNVTLYNNSIITKSQVAIQLLKVQKDKAKEIAQSSVKDYESYNWLFTPFKTKPIPDMRPLELDKKAYFYAGQSYLQLAEYSKAVDALVFIKDDDDKNLVEQAAAARIIAFEQLGKSDQVTKIEEQGLKVYPDFKQFVTNYRQQLLGK